MRIRSRYRFRDPRHLSACARVLLAREGLEHLWGEEEPTPEAEAVILEAGSPGWALLLVARMLHRSEANLSLAFLAGALGQHTEAACSLVDAARTSAEAIDVWLATERARAA